MKLKLEQLYRANGAIKRLLLQPVPISVARKFKKIFLEDLNSHYVEIEKKHVELITKYGKVDEDGNQEFDHDSQKEFLKEFSEYLAETIHIEWEPISLDDLGDTTKISTRDLEDMSFLIDEDE